MGQRVRGLLDYLESGIPEDNVAEVASVLLPRLNNCIAIGEKYQLPLLQKLQFGQYFTNYAKMSKW